MKRYFVETARIVRLVVFCFALYSMMSCNKQDYKSAIPANCVALMSVDFQQLGDAGAVRQLTALMGLDDIGKSGIDLTSRAYLFETAEGSMGLCAAVGDGSDLKAALEKMAASGKCSSPQTKHDVTYSLLVNSWLLGTSGNTALVIGPITPSQQAEAMRTVRKWLAQDEGEGAVATGMFSRLDTMKAAVGLVCQAKALPEKLALPFMLGAPKSADASRVMVAAQIREDNGLLFADCETFSENKDIDNEIRKSMKMFRGVSKAAVDGFGGDMPVGLFCNVNGADLLGCLRQNAATQSLLAGVNTLIDIDNILRSVDGDVVMALPAATTDAAAIDFTAKLADTKWMADIGYWKESCPKGSSLSAVGKNVFCCSGGSGKFFFAVTPKSYFTCGQSLARVTRDVETTARPLPQPLRACIEGKKMAVVVSTGNMSGNADMPAMAKSLLGDIKYICCFRK